jgi:hypothetical protein
MFSKPPSLITYTLLSLALFAIEEPRVMALAILVDDPSGVSSSIFLRTWPISWEFIRIALVLSAAVMRETLASPGARSIISLAFAFATESRDASFDVPGSSVPILCEVSIMRMMFFALPAVLLTAGDASEAIRIASMSSCKNIRRFGFKRCQGVLAWISCRRSCHR